MNFGLLKVLFKLGAVDENRTRLHPLDRRRLFQRATTAYKVSVRFFHIKIEFWLLNEHFRKTLLYCRFCQVIVLPLHDATLGRTFDLFATLRLVPLLDTSARLYMHRNDCVIYAQHRVVRTTNNNDSIFLCLNYQCTIATLPNLVDHIGLEPIKLKSCKDFLGALPMAQIDVGLWILSRRVQNSKNSHIPRTPWKGGGCICIMLLENFHLRHLLPRQQYASLSLEDSILVLCFVSQQWPILSSGTCRFTQNFS